jgi:hypothetical protein
MSDDAEARYQEWRKRHEAYLAAIEANGGTPWTADEDERRALWFRRFQRPEPPQFLSPIPSIKEFNAA